MYFKDIYSYIIAESLVVLNYCLQNTLCWTLEV